MIDATSSYATGIQQIEIIYALVKEGEGTAKDKLDAAIPAMEAIQENFKHVRIGLLNLSEISFTDAGKSSNTLTAIQRLLPVEQTLSAEKSRLLALHIIKIKTYITTFCFHALNNELIAGLRMMREKCQKNSETIEVLVEKYTAKQRTIDEAHSLFKKLRKQLKEFRAAASEFSKKGQNLERAIALDNLEIPSATAEVMKNLEATFEEISDEYNKIKDSIDSLTRHISPLFQQLIVETDTPGELLAIEIIDKSNTVEAMADHLNFLKAHLDVFKRILNERKATPLAFLSRVVEAYHHLLDAGNRMNALYETRDQKQMEFLASCDVDTPDSVVANALKTYNWYAEKAKQCDEIYNHVTFAKATAQLDSAMEAEGYPHFDEEGHFKEPFTFQSDFWLLKSLTLYSFDDFQLFQETVFDLKIQTNRMYTKIVGDSVKMVALHPFASLQKKIKNLPTNGPRKEMSP